MDKSNELDKLFQALSKAQSEMDSAVKDSNNPFYKQKFANLESCINASRPSLTRNGLAVIQTLGKENECHFLDTMLAHSSGQFITSRLYLEIEKGDRGKALMQNLGTAITYARRYAYVSIIGLNQEDDDGHSLRGKKEIESKPDYSLLLKKAMAQNSWTSDHIANFRDRFPHAPKKFNEMSDAEKKTFIEFLEKHEPTQVI